MLNLLRFLGNEARYARLLGSHEARLTRSAVTRRISTAVSILTVCCDGAINADFHGLMEKFRRTLPLREPTELGESAPKCIVEASGGVTSAIFRLRSSTPPSRRSSASPNALRRRTFPSAASRRRRRTGRRSRGGRDRRFLAGGPEPPSDEIVPAACADGVDRHPVPLASLPRISVCARSGRRISISIRRRRHLQFRRSPTGVSGAATVATVLSATEPGSLRRLHQH